MADRSNENVIDWLTNSKKASATFGQQKYISRIKKLAEDHPENVHLDINTDGSVFATFPLSWIKISANKRNMTEEQREAAAERLRLMREKKKGAVND